MKKAILSGLFALTTLFSTTAQSGINYQAVVRDANGNILANENVNVEFRIISTSTSGTTEYAETQSLNTNAYGNVVAIIGQGTPTLGIFNNIDWENDDHFLNIQINGTDMGTTQFMSVPYALHAKSAQVAETGTNEFLIDSILVIENDGEAYDIKTGVDGKMYFQRNGWNDISNATLILDDDSQTISRPQSGVDTDLLPIAYGNVDYNGTLLSGSSNVGNITTTTTGQYVISITSESLSSSNHVVLVNTFGNSNNNVSADFFTGNLNVYVRDVATSPSNYVNGGFSFIIYKP